MVLLSLKKKRFNEGNSFFVTRGFPLLPTEEWKMKLWQETFFCACRISVWVEWGEMGHPLFSKNLAILSSFGGKQKFCWSYYYSWPILSTTYSRNHCCTLHSFQPVVRSQPLTSGLVTLVALLALKIHISENKPKTGQKSWTVGQGQCYSTAKLQFSAVQQCFTLTYLTKTLKTMF